MDMAERLRKLAEKAEQATKEAVTKAGDLAHEKRDTLHSGLDKVANAVDDRTQGKYADKVAKAKQQASKGVDKIADHRRDSGHPGPVGPDNDLTPNAPSGYNPPPSPPVSENPAPRENPPHGA